ncbi:MAG: hypothetical protein RLZZ297_1912, partial [Chloroflexota bacterium]
MTSDFLLDVQAQPALLHDALTTHVAAQSPVLAAAAYVQAHRHQRIVITGMGSSFYSAYPAVLQLLAAGYAVQHVELSELLHFA